MTLAAPVLNITGFNQAALAGGVPKGTIIRLALASEPAFGGEDRVVSFVFSDNSVDSYGDTIDARGWDLKAFEANPIALFGHDATKPENVVGKARNVRIQGNRLVGDIEFAAVGVNPVAETVFQMVKNGYLNAVSVGFEPVEWVAAKDKARPGGIDFTKQKLREISIVPIPANENALVQARAAGIDVDRLALGAPVVVRDFKVTKKGLYSVSDLACLLSSLGYLQDSSAWEAEYEGDGSEVPAMLLDAMKQLANALLAMVEEEVAELLDGREPPEPPEIIELATATPAQKAFLEIAKALQPRITVHNIIEPATSVADDADARALRLRRAKAMKLQLQLTA